jgi:hypothetical protein
MTGQAVKTAKPMIQGLMAIQPERVSSETRRREGRAMLMAICLGASRDDGAR